MCTKLDTIRVGVKITRLEFFLLGWILKRLDEESAKESNKESDNLTGEVLFFGWGEEVTKTLGWKLDEAWSYLSNEEIYFLN